jgi:tight adherence protein B
MTHVTIAVALAFISMLAIVGLLAHQLTQRSAKYREGFEKQAARKLRSQFLFVNPERVFSLKLILVLAGMGFAWWLWESPVMVVLLAIAAGLLPAWWIRRMQTRRLAAFRGQLPDVLMLLAGNLRAGSGLAQAMEQMTREMPMPSKQEFSLVLRELRLGTTLMNALANLERRVNLEELGLVVAAARIATENGANLAEAFEVLAETLRTKMAIEDKIAALTAQGRLQAWVISSMPLLVMFMLKQIQPDAIAPLFDTYLGWAALFLVFFFELCGLLMIRRIVAIEI